MKNLFIYGHIKEENIMDWDAYKQYLLSSIPSAKQASGGTTINCRCMECPDSSNPKSAHFYISIPYDSGKPSMYYCHKCGCSGIVTHKQLIAWNIFDKNIAMQLDEYNSSLKYKSFKSRYFKDEIYFVNNRTTTQDEKSEFKRQYICNRIGKDLSYKDLRDLKIVINLMDLLKENGITKFTRDHNIITDLDREFIGFLSVDNAFLNMRRTCNEGIVYKSIDTRYVNYKIFDKFDTSQRFYTIPTKVNLATPNRIKLHIAEGPFDILSIYLNVRNKEEGIYTSIAGSNYMNDILYFMLDMKLPYLELHLYPDNDKYGNLSRMKYIMRSIPDKSIPVYIHRNMTPGEKDFGVPMDHIKESILQIN